MKIMTIGAAVAAAFSNTRLVNFTAISFSSLIASSCFAATVDLSSCVLLENDELRLKCYDVVSGYVGAASDSTGEDKSADEQSASDWVFLKDRDDFSDKETSYVYLEPISMTQRGDDPPEALVLACDGNGSYNVYMVADGYIGGQNDRVSVRYRFGDKQPITESWNESVSGRAAFLPAGYKDFRNSLITGEDFLFEITDFRGATSSAKFNNASDDKLEYVMGGCR